MKMSTQDAHLEETLASLTRANTVVLAHGAVTAHSTQQAVSDLDLWLLDT